MIESTRPELSTYQEERLAKFVSDNQKLGKGQIVFAGDSITEFFSLKKYLGRDLPLINRGIAGTDSVWLLEHLKEQVWTRLSYSRYRQSYFEYGYGSSSRITFNRDLFAECLSSQ